MAERPNIVVVITHDTGTHLGTYGVPTVHTPTLDALAADGVRFDSHFCAAPQCCPSRAALFTGRYPHSSGVMGLSHMPFGWRYNPGERHVAALLKDVGYSTQLLGMKLTSAKTRESILASGFDAYGEAFDGRDVAGLAEEYFTSRAHAGEPFFAQIALFETHRPFLNRDFEITIDDSKGVYVPSYMHDDEPARQEFAELQGIVRRADELVGRMYDALEGAGLADNTVFIFTTDHGLAMPRAKGTLYDPGIRIAQIARWPAGGARGGRVVGELTSNVDVVPTLQEIAGAETPANVQGRSFADLLCGRPGAAGREDVFAELTFHNRYHPMRGIRTERYKYFRHFEIGFRVMVPSDVMKGPSYRAHVTDYLAQNEPMTELYDLASDPWETENLTGRTELADVERDLDERLARWMTETGDPLLDGPVPSPAAMDVLRELPD